MSIEPENIHAKAPGGSMRLTRVAVLQPWLPQYRRQFYERVHAEGRLRGIQLDVFYGQAPLEWRARGDTITSAIATELPTRFFRVGSRSFIWKSTKSLRVGEPYDLFIVEQAIRNLETYGLIWRRRVPVAFWGHGRTYTKRVSQAQERLKEWLTRQGVWFFGYTDAGVRSIVDKGFPVERTTVLQNTIDASGLRSAVEGVDPEQRAAFIRKHALTDKTAIYIGGLDEMKRIPFLLESARRAHALDPDFRLLIAGNGTERAMVQHASIESPFVVYLGPVFGDDKALALSAASVIANPGRVGLSAVDGFAAGLPIVTTDWPLHAPEFEYLENGKNSVITADSLGEYVSGLTNLLASKRMLAQLTENCRADSLKYSLDVMVERFLGGIEAAVSSTRTDFATKAWNQTWNGKRK